jgi:hypothetical protein
MIHDELESTLVILFADFEFAILFRATYFDTSIHHFLFGILRLNFQPCARHSRPYLFAS